MGKEPYWQNVVLPCVLNIWCSYYNSIVMLFYNLNHNVEKVLQDSW